MQDSELLGMAFDRLRALLAKRELDKRQLFNDFVEPLFGEAGVVVTDYLALFSEAERALTQTPPSDIRDVIRTRREVLLVKRRQVTAMASIVADRIKEPSVRRFAARLSALFSCTVHRAFDTRSASKVLVDLLSVDEPLSVNRDYVLYFVSASRQQAEGLWMDVARHYAASRLALLAPRGL